MPLPFQIIDLTHTLMPDIPIWDGVCGFQHTIVADYDGDLSKTQFRVQQLIMQAGIGTHIDAPSHCIAGAKSVADIPLTELIAPCIVINIAASAHANYSLSLCDINAFESQYGTIPAGSFVIVYTGWDKYWHSPALYKNNYVFPSVTAEAAMLLLQRNIVGLGIDTLSPDRPESKFAVHQILLTAGKYIVENIANAANLPPTGAYSLALPIKAAQVTEAPMRLIALLLSS